MSRTPLPSILLDPKAKSLDSNSSYWRQKELQERFEKILDTLPLTISREDLLHTFNALQEEYSKGEGLANEILQNVVPISIIEFLRKLATNHPSNPARNCV